MGSGGIRNGSPEFTELADRAILRRGLKNTDFRLVTSAANAFLLLLCYQRQREASVDNSTTDWLKISSTSQASQIGAAVRITPLTIFHTNKRQK